TAKKSRGGGAGGGGSHGIGDHLRQFARSRPEGWGHDDWLGLLEELRGHGHDVSDESAVGRQLERERLLHQLEGVDGLGDRAGALAERFGTLYSLRHAGVDEIAGVQGIDRETAERIKQRFG
ncbi:MAG: helix-hairpin-helix domain-containing protein, partial [Gemmatimonadota bacterium]